MVSFVSLFVGFVLGIVNVQLMVSGGVDRVELLLDGQPVAGLREPFSTRLDLGCEPAPHELVAVAYDEQGTELARARQWINRPRATAEASLVLEAGEGGTGRVAQLTWRALAGEVPVSVTATFDGAPLPVGDGSRIELPAHEPTRIHYVGAVVDFGKGISASAEMIFGGSRTVETHTELTAVAVQLEKRASLPPVGDLAGWFEAKGVPLEVAAVEAGGIDIVFVAEGSGWESLHWLAALSARQNQFSISPAESLAGLLFFRKPKGEDLRLRFLWPVGRLSAQTEMVANVYPSTPWLSRNQSAASFLNWREWAPDGQRLADAVVVAGLEAAEANRKRAVVLLLGPKAKDGSLVTPDEAMRFLKRLGVPVQVWSIGEDTSKALPWKAERRVRSFQDFDEAMRLLLRQLDRQRIFWIEGAHLPHEVEPSNLARGLRPVE
jgi:hypothetical protein